MLPQTSPWARTVHSRQGRQSNMAEGPINPYVEVREGGYYIADSRIGLDVVVREFQDGKSPEAILQSYPSIGSLAKVYGSITFILEHPEAVNAYLNDRDRLWKELQQKHPI